MTETIANRYRILAELGQGNMGAVYRVADSLENDRELALKVIRVPGAITPELRLLFKEEFRAMAKLKHPNTIAVFGYGELDERAQYLTMEIVPGRELAEVIGAKPMALAEAYPLLIQLLQALGFIHSRLFVHHDIKAQNIRVTPEGTLKLMDFGLMCQLGRPAIGGRVTGTPGYLPPEIVRGGTINAATDLYSVGCLAFEMLTGRLPFSGKVGEVIRAHVHEAPPTLRSLRRDAPLELERIVAKLLEKDQDRRYQEASEVIADLAALAGLEVARENLDQRTSYLTTGALVAREAEIAQLEGALAEASAGRGNGVFVTSPAGVGKSRLVQELVLHAKLDGIVVAHGQCLEAGQDPYEPMRQALRALAPLATPDEAAEYAPMMHKLAPELFPAGPCDDEPDFENADEERMAIFRAVEGFLSTLTRRTPVLLLIDDMHWGDLQSIELFNHLVRQCKGMRLMCVGTLRCDETPDASPVWYTVDEGLATWQKLEAFTPAQMVKLIEAMLHRVALTPFCVEFLYGATAGNAFFLTELLRHLMEEGVLVLRDGVWRLEGGPGSYEPPKSVEETVMRRLAHLSPGARDLARTASAFGRYLERDMLLHVGRLDPETLFVRMDELIERQFLTREQNRYSFPHDRVWEALYADLSAEERQDVHQRCGEYLERVHGEGSAAHVAELAHHFSHGRDPVKAYRYLDRAGDAAVEAGAPGEALQCWLRAEKFLETLDHPTKLDDQLELWWGICGQGFNMWPMQAVEAARKIVAALEGPGADRPDAAAERIKAYALLAVSHGFCGQPRAGLEAAESALALLPQGPSPMRAALLVCKVANLFPAGRYDEVRALCAEADRYFDGMDLTGQPPLVWNTRVGAVSYPNTTAFQGVRPDAERAEVAIARAIEARSPSILNIIRAYFGLWYAWTGRETEAIASVEETLQYCRKLAAPPYPWALYMRPYVLWQRGEFDDARTLIDTYLRYSHLGQLDMSQQLMVVLKGQLHLSQGQLDEADAAFKAAEARGREESMAVVLMRALLGRGELAIARREAAEATRVLGEVLAIARDPATRNPLHEGLAERLLGEAALAQRLYTRAREHAERAMAIFTRPEQDNAIEQGHVHRLLAEIALGQGDPVAAGVAFRKAGEVYHGLKNRHWLHTVNRHLETLHQQPEATRTVEATPEERFEHLRGMLMR